MTKKIIHPRDGHKEGLPIQFDEIGMTLLEKPFVMLPDGNMYPVPTKIMVTMSLRVFQPGTYTLVVDDHCMPHIEYEFFVEEHKKIDDGWPQYQEG